MKTSTLQQLNCVSTSLSHRERKKPPGELSLAIKCVKTLLLISVTAFKWTTEVDHYAGCP